MARLAHEIERTPVRVVRIHVSGDFYSAAYVDRWANVIRRCPAVTFFAYTRSWRAPAILAALRRLAVLENMHLWFSEDRDSGASPPAARVRVCFLVHEHTDDRLVDGARHDLVFRTGQHRSVAHGAAPVKKINGVQVCPYDQWYAWRPAMAGRRRVPPAITCALCRICFRTPAAGK